MDHPGNHNPNALSRQLSNLKLISRLLGHELHNQGGSKSIALSRDEVVEIQTTIDLFIEEASRRGGGKPTAGGLGGAGLGTNLSGPETSLLPARN